MATATATAHPRRGASSIAPPPPISSSSVSVSSVSSSSSSSAAASSSPSSSHHHHHRRRRRPRAPDTDPDTPEITAGSSQSLPPPPVPSILQPRVAVVLNVPPPWHPWLFALRLSSVLPALWWGLPSLLRLLLHFLPGPPDQFLVVRPVISSSSSSSCAVECDAGGTTTTVVAAPYALTETALATIWCFACGYLAFFFTDCLMSRWLINYTPQATIVRLLSINAVNAYLTLSMLSLTGGFEDPRLLLPGWTLTVCYHITHQKINIRKETSTSVNVFSIASYITMVVLLAHMQSYQPDYPAMPVVARGRQLWHEVMRLVAHVKTLMNEHAEL